MTVFQKIIDREIPADIVLEDEHVLAFRDIDPQAPVHVLVIPKKPIARLGDASDADAGLLGRLVAAAARVAADEGVADSGYRLVINTGIDGGQAVDHLHVHVLGGRKMSWPPG